MVYKSNPKDRFADGTSAIVGRAERIKRSNKRGWSGWSDPHVEMPRSFLSALKADNSAHDPYLRQFVGRVAPAMIMSGIGGQPAIVPLRDFCLGGFTTGCGGVA